MGAEEEDQAQPRWRTPLLWVLCLASMAGAFLIGLEYVDPLDTSALQGYDEPDYWNGSMLLPVLAIPAVLVTAHYSPHWYLWVAGALAAPLAMGVIGVMASDKLAAQREGKDIYERYTHRFPDEELGSPRIVEHDGNYLTVCASQAEREPTDFCLELITTRPTGEEIQGGFRYLVDELVPEAGFISREQFDCFGDPVKECQD